MRTFVQAVLVTFAFILYTTPAFAGEPTIAAAAEEQLMAQLEEMIGATSTSDDPKTRTTNAILLTLKGLMLAGKTQEFAEEVLVPYLEKELEAVRAAKSPEAIELEKYKPVGTMNICTDVQMQCTKMVLRETDEFYALYDGTGNLKAITKVRPGGSEEVVWGKLPTKKNEHAI